MSHGVVSACQRAGIRCRRAHRNLRWRCGDSKEASGRDGGFSKPSVAGPDLVPFAGDRMAHRGRVVRNAYASRGVDEDQAAAPRPWAASSVMARSAATWAP